jgi:hypothetical protein
LALVVLVVLGVLGVRAALLAATGGFHVAQGFYVELIVYAAYLIVLRRPGLWLGRKLKAWSARSAPSYTLADDALVLENLFRGKPHQYTVRLGFDELDEVRELSDVEAQDLLKYRMGPDLTVAAAAAKDLIRWVEGQIPRPATFVRNALRPGGRTLLLRGPQVLYLVAIAEGDHTDLLNAFEAYKRRTLRDRATPDAL